MSSTRNPDSIVLTARAKKKEVILLTFDGVCKKHASLIVHYHLLGLTPEEIAKDIKNKTGEKFRIKSIQRIIDQYRSGSRQAEASGADVVTIINPSLQPNIRMSSSSSPSQAASATTKEGIKIGIEARLSEIPRSPQQQDDAAAEVRPPPQPQLAAVAASGLEGLPALQRQEATTTSRPFPTGEDCSATNLSSVPLENKGADAPTRSGSAAFQGQALSTTTRPSTVEAVESDPAVRPINVAISPISQHKLPTTVARPASSTQSRPADRASSSSSRKATEPDQRRPTTSSPSSGRPVSQRVASNATTMKPWRVLWLTETGWKTLVGLCTLAILILILIYPREILGSLVSDTSIGQMIYPAESKRPHDHDRRQSTENFFRD